MLSVLRWKSRLVFYMSSFIACGILAVTTGCVSGGFKLTRQYAGWVNSQMLILRIVIYLLTGIVFAVTVLVDAVVFNTMDFWEGKVSASDFNHREGDKNYHVHHEILKDSQLKKTTIEVSDAEKKLLQKIELAETASGEIELFIDGKLRTKVQGISSIPLATVFDTSGAILKEEFIIYNYSSELTLAATSRGTQF